MDAAAQQSIAENQELPETNRSLTFDCDEVIR